MVKFTVAFCQRNEPVDNSGHDVDDIGSQIEEMENPLYAHRLGAHETTLISNMPESEEMTIAPDEGKQPMSILNYQFCEKLAHQHLFRTGNFGYKIERNVKLNPFKYFNQRFLNYKQKFASLQYFFLCCYATTKS